MVRDRRPIQTSLHHASIVMDGGTQDQLEPVGGNPETSLYCRKERLNLGEEAVSLLHLLWVTGLTCPLQRNLAKNDINEGEKQEMMMRGEAVRMLWGLSELPHNDRCHAVPVQHPHLVRAQSRPVTESSANSTESNL